MAHYRDSEVVFTERETETRSANAIEVLWVREEGATVYGRYLEGQLDPMMADAAVKTEAKVNALYASSKSVTLEILATPTRENMDWAEDVVQHTVGQVLGDPRSLAAMVAGGHGRDAIDPVSVAIALRKRERLFGGAGAADRPDR
jgi:hypothetical protein